MAEQHERRKDTRSLVEDIAATSESDRHRADPARTDRDCDQHHHVEGPVAKSSNGAVEEDPARIEDHRQAQDKLEDVVAKPEWRSHIEVKNVAPDARPEQDG